MIKEAAHCRIFKVSDEKMAPGPWDNVEIAWITPEGNDEVVVVIREGEAYLTNRRDERMALALGAARHLHHQARHKIRYRESPVQGEGWKGRYRCYGGRLEGVHRFILDEGQQLPSGLGREVTRCDLEVSLPPLHMSSLMRVRPRA